MIYEFAGKKWKQCDNCGDLISGQAPTKKDIQRAAGIYGLSYPVYNMCKICSENYRKNNKKWFLK